MALETVTFSMHQVRDIAGLLKNQAMLIRRGKMSKGLKLGLCNNIDDITSIFNGQFTKEMER